MNASLLERTSPHQENREYDDMERTAELATEILNDLRLAGRVEQALRATGYAPLRNLEAQARDGVVVLKGRVPSYHLKQLAQATALAVPETRQVCNDLDVVAPA